MLSPKGGSTENFAGETEYCHPGKTNFNAKCGISARWKRSFRGYALFSKEGVGLSVASRETFFVKYLQ